ncbi:ATP-binding protein [uncultured Pseudodesulfovibrio sp.]|uniref:ATP-binding protein n=1 Tax=uncultured Pseudodesulfovibrio sp. TaxID=2035858 RepID=UPI0029C99C52|nr:ATP-binding protein [uncultured Pseudodesulfovibrio sp.]
MIYAIASGKGGTGKTTVSASLVSLWDRPVTAVDLDVEEPNLHLFLKPELDVTEKAYMEIPVADEDKCTKCRACADICQYKAITVMADTLLIFPEMCHGCGGCLAVCPEGVLTPGKRELGEILRGKSGDKDFVMGRLRIGEAMSPPLMEQIKHQYMRPDAETDIVVDAPPGVSCPAVSAVIDTDCIVLVTEPTPFGFHDFKLAWEAFSPFGKPMGAVINRAGMGDDSVQKFCKEKNIPIWAEIPYDRAIAEAYSHGKVIAEALEPLRDTFHELRRNMQQAAEAAREVSHA